MSRTGETVHLLGPGAVGRAVLERLASSRRVLTAVSDSTGTLFAPQGLDPLAVVRWKEAGQSLRDHPAAEAMPPGRAIAIADADLLIDTSATELGRAGWTDAIDGALDRGAAVAFAAKAAACERGAEWLSGPHARRVGLNAVLGGTGRRLIGELSSLQRRCRGIAIVGNASTTTILEAMERGASLDEGIAEAQRLGFLESDPSQDLRGDDAAVKLAIVAGLITQTRIDPGSIVCEDIRHIAPLVVRERARRGATTRLVARLRDGALRVAYEEVARASLLAAPCGTVVYEYSLDRGDRRFHLGRGLGAAATAAALCEDLSDLSRAVASDTPLPACAQTAAFARPAGAR